MLTRKQYELLIFIDRRLKETGVSPSFEEMKDALNLKSKSGIHRLITALEERNFIRRLPHRARALEILKLPEHAIQSRRPHNTSFTPEILPGGKDKKIPELHPAALEAEVIDLPIIGRIAAGNPAWAETINQETTGIPASMMSTNGEHFVLEVRGESMIDAGIYDGDLAVINTGTQINSGDIVVAIIAEDNEATLKRIRKRGGAIALEPANAAFQTKIYHPEQLDIKGKLVGLIRHY